MKKYYVTNTNKTKFVYVTTIPSWCIDGGKTKLMYDTKPHFFSFERAKRVIAQLKKYNMAGYQIFETEITLM